MEYIQHIYNIILCSFVGDECPTFRWMHENLFKIELENLGFEEGVTQKIEEFHECLLRLYYLHKTRGTSRTFYSSW